MRANKFGVFSRCHLHVALRPRSTDRESIALTPHKGILINYLRAVRFEWQVIAAGARATAWLRFNGASSQPAVCVCVRARPGPAKLIEVPIRRRRWTDGYGQRAGRDERGSFQMRALALAPAPHTQSHLPEGRTSPSTCAKISDTLRQNPDKLSCCFLVLGFIMEFRVHTIMQRCFFAVFCSLKNPQKCFSPI